MNKILIAEDDEQIAILERDYLEINGYECDIVDDGRLVVQKLLEKDQAYSLLLLDVMMPGIDGFEVCRKIRDKIDIPILMVTARGELIDKIRGLGLGADDYIVKPFEANELIARVKAHLKRAERLIARGREEADAEHTFAQTEKQKDDNSILIGKIRILPESWKAYNGEVEIKFPNREFELLKFLAVNPNIVFSKDTLFERIWGYDYIGDSTTVAVHINRIREKIEEDPTNPRIIETVRGAGYRLNK